MASPFRSRNYQGDGCIGFKTAVIETQRFDNPACGHVFVHRERCLHHGMIAEHRICSLVYGDRPEYSRVGPSIDGGRRGLQPQTAAAALRTHRAPYIATRAGPETERRLFFPMRFSLRELIARQQTTVSATPADTASAVCPITECETLPPPLRSSCHRQSEIPSASATMLAGAESPTRWVATPSSADGSSPASSRASAIARTARVRVETPEFLRKFGVTDSDDGSESRNGNGLTSISYVTDVL